MAANTLAELKALFGSAWHEKGNDIVKRIAYTTYAGDPTNNVVPDFIGQECLDTSNSAWYKAHGTAAANWKKLTP
jgi:hypothetical protein